MSNKRKQNEVNFQVARCQSITGSVQENLINLIRQTQGKNDDTLSAEALHDARNVIYYSNLLSGAMSELIRSHSPAEFNPGVELVMHDPIYKIAVDSEGVYLRVPLVPYSVQRNSQRMSASGKDATHHAEYWARRRYSEVDALLNHVQSPRLYGRKILYILHVYDTKGKYRMSPDFDNYDVKDLIDVVTAHFGGDNPGNIIVIHDAMYSSKMMAATYLAVNNLDLSGQIEDYMYNTQVTFENMDSQQ